MIRVDIRKGNRIVNLDTPMKQSIQARQGSIYFHNSFELLACALGSCAGNNILKLCQYEEIDPSIFESIYIDVVNFKCKIIIQVPEDLDPQLKSQIETTLKTCEIGKMLNDPPEIEFKLNETPTKELIKVKAQSCCGG